ncbi:MAG TPA: glycosyltransferase [Euryarchaeota archaeon]|nr:glycosyltransferase [Euryarchaeota archaeon]
MEIIDIDMGKDFKLLFPCFSMDFISVIVAVRNEEEYIKKSLDSLLDQSIGFYEIIVVDGNSEDGTLSIVKEYKKKYPEKIRVFQNPKKRQVFGRNIGIKNSRGNFIVYIDGHTYAEKNWLESLYKTLKDSKKDVGGVGSVHLSPKSENFIQRAINNVFTSFLGGFTSSYRSDFNTKEVITAPFVMYRREVLEKLGFYDEKMLYGEDFDLNYRINKGGYKILLQPKAITYYIKRKTLKDFIKQMYKYGKGRAYILKKHPDSFKFFYLSPIFFFLCFFLPFLSLISEIFLYLFLVYYGIFFIAFFLSSIRISIKEKDIRFLSCTCLYFIEYFFYGLGLIYNYIKLTL